MGVVGGYTPCEGFGDAVPKEGVGGRGAAAVR